MRLISRLVLRRAVALAVAAAALAPAGAVHAGRLFAPVAPISGPGDGPVVLVARKQQPPERIDPALRELAAQKARAVVLASADAERQCPLTLTADPVGAGFQLELDRPACEAAIAFLAEVASWLPDPSGSLRFLNAQGRTVAEFTEGTGGSYEALREGDGVYFLSDPSVGGANEVTAAEVTGEWDLATSAGKPLCRWTLADEPAPKGGRVVKVAPGCDSSMARLAPVAWRLEGGNIVIATRGGPAILFARQEDGGWARVPERGRPLLMGRP